MHVHFCIRVYQRGLAGRGVGAGGDVFREARELLDVTLQRVRAEKSGRPFVSGSAKCARCVRACVCCVRVLVVVCRVRVSVVAWAFGWYCW